MAGLKIILGNKNYSSWSLRPWLVLKHLAVPFDEKVIPLDQPGTREEILRHSPAGRVPVLEHEGRAIWDSLAICEYLNEIFPEAHLWPRDRADRALARSVSAEMHSGFTALRENMPMKIRESLPGVGRSPEVDADIRRIREIWSSLRLAFGGRGPFLFGTFSIADAMFAPVATRFRTYDVPLEGVMAEYVETLLNLPAMKEWSAAAHAEPLVMKRYEH